MFQEIHTLKDLTILSSQFDNIVKWCSEEWSCSVSQIILLNPVPHLMGGHLQKAGRFQHVPPGPPEGFSNQALDGFGIIQLF